MRGSSLSRAKIAKLLALFGFISVDVFTINLYKTYCRSIQHVPKDEVLKQLEKPKLPGELGEMAGAVLYPDEVTSKWDNEGLCAWRVEKPSV